MGKADGRPWSSKSNRQRVSPATLSATLSLLECLLMETLPPHPRQTGWGGSLSGKSGLPPRACLVASQGRPWARPTMEATLGCLPRAPMGTPTDGSNTPPPPPASGWGVPSAASRDSDRSIAVYSCGWEWLLVTLVANTPPFILVVAQATLVAHMIPFILVVAQATHVSIPLDRGGVVASHSCCQPAPVGGVATCLRLLFLWFPRPLLLLT